MADISKRVKNTQKPPDEQLAEKPPFPKSLKIEITSRCDLKCYFCTLTYKERGKGDIDRDLLFKIIREAKDLGVKDLGLFWLGEPLLVPQLPEYVAYGKKIGIPYVFITTNGRMATRERIAPLIDSGIDSIKFSFNAVTRDEYKKVTGVDAFERVLANIASTHEVRGDRKKPSLYASTVFDPNNAAKFDRAVELIRPYVDEHYRLRQYGIQEGNTSEVRTLQEMLPCWSLFSIPHISYQGHISACYCDHESKFFMGDLNKMSLLEAWHSDAFVKLRRRHLAKDVSGTPCADCTAYSH
ncbi:MAG: radical SAM protein [Elusimicrobiota bacterium]